MSSSTGHTFRLKYHAVWLVIGWLLVIAVICVSLLPDLPSTSFQNTDKIGHVVSYGVLMWWFVQLTLKRSHLSVAIGLIALGITLEFIQSATGYRTGEMWDVAANVLGVLLGWGLSQFSTLQFLHHIDRMLSGH